MSDRNQINNDPERTGDFVESLNSFKSEYCTIKGAIEAGLLHLVSAYHHSQGFDRDNIGMLLEGFGKISDALCVIDGILECELAPRVEAK